MLLPTRYRLKEICLKFLVVLLVWYTILFLIVRTFTTDHPNNDINNEVQRQLKLSGFLRGRKILENILHNVEADELILGDSKETHLPELISAIEKEQPSLPFRFWHVNKRKKLEINSTCAVYPNPSTLRYHNKYWQTFETLNTTVQLYSAFYDNRPTPSQSHVVRVLAMINQTPEQKFPAMYCQLWYAERSTPVIVKVSLFRMIWFTSWGNGTGQLYPYLFSCPVPKSQASHIPQVVSLVSKVCDKATNSMRIEYAVPQPPKPKRQFAVCVKGLDFPKADIAARLVEWIELQLLLGADKIFFYHLDTHPHVSKVLDYYQQRGVVDVKQLTLAGSEPSTPLLQRYLLESQRLRKRLNELIPYNDCFYRNLYRYEYVAVQDIDEVFMPLGNRTQWSELVSFAALQRSKKCKYGFGSYCFRNVYFPRYENSALFSTSVPSYMYMLQHVRRSSQHLPKGMATKCFHRTDGVITLHNHYSIAWMHSICPSYTFEPDVAQMQHYREPKNLEHLSDNMEDVSVWRFKDALLERSKQAFRELGFLASAN